MTITRTKQLAAVLVATAAGAAFFVAPASGGPTAQVAKTKTVTVADDYFTPATVNIGKGSSVKWVWSDFNFNSHNVKLTNKHPKGVKKGQFSSDFSGAIGLKFKRTFSVKGTYKFFCSLHPTVMKMTVKVGK